MRVSEGLTLVVRGGQLDGEEWVVQYELEDYRLRLLADSPFGGYTHVPGRALRREPEAVSAEYQTQLSAEAECVRELRAEGKVEQEISDLGIARALDQTLRLAKTKGVDTSSVEHVTQRQLARLRRRMARLEAAA